MIRIMYLLCLLPVSLVPVVESKTCTGLTLAPGKRVHKDKENDYPVHEDYDDNYFIKGRQLRDKQYKLTLSKLMGKKKLKEVQGSCNVDISEDFGNPSPIFIHNGKLLDHFGPKGNFILEHGQTVIVACPGKGRLIVLGTEIYSTHNEAEARCLNEKMFEVGNWQGEFKNIECNSAPHLTIKRSGKENAVLEAELYQIGFVVNGLLHELYTAYFNSHIVTTFYVHHSIVPNAHLRQLGGGRPYFHTEKEVFGKLRMSRIYNVASQRRHINALLGEEPNANKFINEIDFLTRTQMAPRLDFVMRTTQRASYTYINTVPQWKHIQHGDWAQLESGLRERAYRLNKTLKVWTGKHEIWKGPMLLGRRTQPLYLARDARRGNQKIVPVPLYIYKLVFVDSNATAFVSINVPSYVSVEEQYKMKFCEDICNNNPQFDWLGWGDGGVSVTFCCSYAKFAEVVSYLPELYVQYDFH